MPSRRCALHFLAATPLLTLACRALARPARAEPGEVYDGELLVPAWRGDERLDPPVPPGRIAATTSRGERAALSRRVQTQHPRVFSIANANDRYTVWLEGPKAATGQFLVLPDGTVAGASSWGPGGGSGGSDTVTFQVDAASARGLAALWGVPVRDRSPLGQGLVARWRPRKPSFKPGEPVEIELVIENTDARAAYVSVGGRQRGPRDNRFDFEVRRSDTKLPKIEAYDFGGLMTYAKIIPGAPITLVVDVRAWAALERGTYQVACRYGAELVVDPTTNASWPAHAHELWELELTGAVEVQID
ncbi:hypothetical protein [Nannocystis sp. SCPEA4]|uniref:hypothetical protein n=1 Tax=Nannocystis sp. SCPEA4 TaxID=2996787 RepID=UPI00226E1285|nr:hypothetical protein [Nannocystis sp. SCPEA4]MCY1060642.1 hypothetical protein [Nannocystis sp. SCPEA4]